MPIMSLSVVQGFSKSLAMTVLSEIGDKTFFVAAILDIGPNHITGLSNLTELSLKRNNITAKGMSALSGFVNSLKLDLERCPLIHGGIVHLSGLSKLEVLHIDCCNCITDDDMNLLKLERVANFLQQGDRSWGCLFDRSHSFQNPSSKAVN
ncbi:hypothetical protein L2E82_38448 [Cichorium intybus]|uniref:Uncharacterized protein n=1 Tax=Cichorium intybus TaxID=13427 RepID=A0ACB9AGB2_CICIN|nr:hypothetical protein L2E82_38448 [Cichorium intybus]